MKRILFFLAVFLLFAQFCFSQVFVGGGLSYQGYSSEIGNSSSKSTTLMLSPLVGYRFDKIDLGFNFFYGNEITSDDDISSIGVGIFGDYNFLTIDKFSILGRANFQYLNTKTTSDGTLSISSYPYPYTIEYNTEIILNTIGISISPIFEYKLFENLNLYTSIGRISFDHSFGSYKMSGLGIVSVNEDISANNFNISISNDISLGFYVFF